MPAGPTARMAVLRLADLFHVWKVNVGEHSGSKSVFLVFEADLHAEHLLDPVLDRLNVARGELRFAIDLFDRAGEISVRKGIDPDAHRIIKLDQPQPRF